MMTPMFLSESQVLVFHEYFGEAGVVVADLERRCLLFAPYLDFYNVLSYASDLKRRVLISGNVVGGQSGGHGLYLARTDRVKRKELFWTRGIGDEYIDSPAFVPKSEDVQFSILNGTHQGVYCLSPDRKWPKRLVADAFTAQWSPDGSRLVYSIWDGRGNSKIFLLQVNASGSSATWLCNGGGEPRWSPDGGQIIFCSWATGEALNCSQIGCIGSDGKDLKLLTPEDSKVGSPLWLPDGKRICFWMSPHFCFMNLANGKITFALRSEERSFHPIDVSPSGRFISLTEESITPRGVEHDAYVYDRKNRKGVDLATFATDLEDVREARAKAEAMLKNPARLSTKARGYLGSILQRLG